MKTGITAPLLFALFVFGPAFAHGEFNTYGENTIPRELRERNVELPSPDQKDDVILGEDRHTHVDRQGSEAICLDEACSKTDFSEPHVARGFAEKTSSFKCNTPEDGQDSVDEGDRVTCPNISPPRQ